MRTGPGVPGVSPMAYIHVVWEPPIEHANNLLEVTHYVFSAFPEASTLTDRDTVDQRVLGTGPSAVWAGPAAGEFVASLNGVGLVPGQRVKIAVRACNSLGCGQDTAPVIFSTAMSVPATMKAPLLTHVNDTAITVGVATPPAYEGGKRVTHYEVEASTAPALVLRTLFLGATTLPLSHTLSDRLLSHAYNFRVRAVSEMGPGEWSEPVYIPSGAAEVPRIPENVAVIGGSVGARHFSISWTMPPTNSSKPTAYRLELAALSCPDGPTACPLDKAITTSYSLIQVAVPECTTGCVAQISSGILPSHKYELRLSAVTKYGAWSLPSPASSLPGVEVVTDSDSPELVHLPSVTTVGQGMIEVALTPPAAHGSPLQLLTMWACDVQSGECLGHNVTLSSRRRVLATSLPTTASIDLPPARNYTVFIEVFNGVGSSGRIAAPGVFTTSDVPMQGYPVALAVPLPGLPAETTMRVIWAAPFDNGVPITSYILNIDGAEVAVDGTTFQFTRINLHPGSWHNYSVRAVNSLGEGTASPHVTFQTATDVPAAPGRPLLKTLLFEEISIEVPIPIYTGGPPITRYDLWLGPATTALPNGTVVSLLVDTATWDNATLLPSRNYTISMPAPAAEYTFRARASTWIGNGEWSEALSVISLSPSPPTAPPNPPVTPGCHGIGQGGTGADSSGGDKAAGDENGAGASGAKGDGGDQAAGDGSAEACGASGDDAVAGCAGSNELCYFDAACTGDVSADPYGGLGCNAGGFKSCRFCGFGAFATIACPGAGAGELSAGQAALSGGDSGGSGGLMYTGLGAFAVALAVLILACRQLRKAKRAGAGRAGELARQKAEIEAKLEQLKAQQAAAGSSADGGAAKQLAALQAELAQVKARLAGLGGDGGDGQHVGALALAEANSRMAMAAKLGRGGDSSKLGKSSTRSESSAEAKGGGGALDGTKLDADDSNGSEILRLRAKLHAQPHFEPGIDDAASMEVNPVLLRDIVVQKRIAREVQSAKSQAGRAVAESDAAAPADGTQRKKRAGVPTFGQSGGLARLNLNVSEKRNESGNLETLRCVQAYLTSQGVVAAQDKVREHCTRPGTNAASALHAVQEFNKDRGHTSDMARAARCTRQHTRPTNPVLQRMRASTADDDRGEQRTTRKTAMDNVAVDLRI